MAQIEQKINSLGVSLEDIERNQQQEKIILDILEQIDIQLLQEVYKDCCPDGWQNNQIPQNRAGIWNDLKDMPSVPGEYSRNALFIVKLLEKIDRGIGQKLRDFAQENIRDFLDCLNFFKNQ